DEPILELTYLRTSKLYIMYYHNWARLIVLGILPISVIGYLNAKIYQAVRRRKGGRKRHDEHLSIILMMIVLTFVLCNLPRLLLNMHELVVLELIDECRDTQLMGFPVWSVIIGFISQVLLCINSSANLIIYCCLGAKFREVTLRYFCRSSRDCRCLHSTEEGGRCKNCGIQRGALDTARVSSTHRPDKQLCVIGNLQEVREIGEEEIPLHTFQNKVSMNNTKTTVGGSKGKRSLKYESGCSTTTSQITNI
ncbi:uncharacterized protein LOC111716716, partial [Eurytemora carolleeae]|uniref:uncharacterized protein LOC111716716 n=1 Tax=Eurytemora carolleeae TaxID=1294199 RepID=UPI000C78EB8D